MNDTNTLFLAILKAALKGQRPAIQQNISPEQWQALFHMAGIHNVLPLFYEAVYAHPSPAKEQALLAAMKQKVRQQVILQTMRTAEFLELFQALTDAGASPLVVKGIVCRQLYPKPDHRPSSDEDILIPPEAFELCHPVMTRMGLVTTEADPDKVYEVPYRRPNSPLYIELHKHLFPPESDAYGDLNRFFADAAQRTVELTVQGHSIRTLGHTDHLLYLLLHAYKHFLHSGFGIRQVCDIVLYTNSYGKNVDWARILKNCKEIRAEKFAAAMFAIGKNHLVFDPHRACYPESWQEIEVDELPMLEDLLSAGLYGSASMSRKHSSNITLDAIAAQKQGRKARGGLVASVFPSAAKLEGRYPYLKKYPYLLPVAWCNRLWHYGGERRKDSNAAEALKIGSERIELMKYYGILE